jgi:hypothetical protein
MDGFPWWVGLFGHYGQFDVHRTGEDVAAHRARARDALVSWGSDAGGALGGGHRGGVDTRAVHDGAHAPHRLRLAQEADSRAARWG